MAYNKARAEKKRLKWKEAEEKKLRELGVNEKTIQRLHTYDWDEFNRKRRYLQRQVEWSPYVDLVSAPTPSRSKHYIACFNFFYNI